MTAISGVLFDLGGVLVELDGVPSLARLLGLEACHDAIHSRWLACPSVALHETGKITAQEFAIRVVDDLGLAISPEAFMTEFSGWLKGPLPGAFELVERIPPSCRVAALSNMSAFHWTRLEPMGLPVRFDRVLLSHEIGVLKPSDHAFQVALDAMELSPREILFLDDGNANVNAAKAMGITAHLVKNPNEAESILRTYGVLANWSE